jgi:hypothetical protein
LVNDIIQLLAPARDLAFADTIEPKSPNQIIHFTSTHAVHIGLLYHRHKRLLCLTPGLQNGRKEAALPKLRDTQLDGSQASVPISLLSVAITVCYSSLAALIAFSAHFLRRFRLDEPLDNHLLRSSWRKSRFSSPWILRVHSRTGKLLTEAIVSDLLLVCLSHTLVETYGGFVVNFDAIYTTT